MTYTCPECDANLGYFIEGDTREYSRVLGVEISEVYDGVLYWVCPDCGLAWPRWFGSDRRDEAARQEVDRHNAIIRSRKSD